MEARSHAVLDAAYREGIRYFDAARSYGRAEHFVASWLEARALAPRAVTVGSKWGYTYVGHWRMDADVHEVKDHTADALRRQYAQSKDVLGEHLSLYQIHSATTDTGVLEDKGVLAELAAIAAAGTAVGLSLSGPRQAQALRVAMDAEVDGVNPFSCVQATFNLLEPSVGGALRDARAVGWGVIVKEALGNGRLTTHERATSHGAALARVARRHDVAVDAVAMAWALSRSGAHVVLSGAVTPEQLESNVASLGVSLGSEDVAVLDGLAEPVEAYWAARKTLSWA